MIISSVQNNAGVISYVGDVAHTVVDGRKILVGHMYEGKSVGEICAQVYMNARVRQFAASLKKELRMK